MVRYPHSLTLLGILAVLAKIVGDLEYSWFLVLAPFWLPTVLAIIFTALGKVFK